MARFRDDDWDDQDLDEPRSSGLGAGAIVAIVFGGMLLLVLLAGGGIFFLVYNAKVSPPPPVAKGTSPRGGRPKPRPKDGGNPPKAVPTWEVVPDAVAKPVALANTEKVVPLGATFPSMIVVPSTPSPFLASGENLRPESKREIWNLATMTKTAEITGIHMAVPGSLSPDGRHLASRLNASGTPVVVLSCKNNKEVFRLQLPKFHSRPYFDFPRSDRLLVVTEWDSEAAYHLFEVPSGPKLREVELPEVPVEKSEALSAGGKYFAFIAGKKVQIHDLDRGKQVGTFDIRMFRPTDKYRELAFSPNGKTLTILMGTDADLRIVLWDLEGNKFERAHVLPKILIQNLQSKPKDYDGRLLQWVDNQGLLLCGEVLIRRTNGTLQWRLNQVGHQTTAARSVLGSSYVARVRGLLTEPRRTLELVEIRPGKVEPIVKKPPIVPTRPAVKPPFVLGNDASPLPAQIEPLPKPKAGLRDSLDLGIPSTEIRKVLFSAADVAVVAIVTIPKVEGNANKKMFVERFDLVTGKSLGKLELFQGGFYPDQMDLSPDGTLLVANVPGDRKRVVAWSLSENKQIADWTPHATSSGAFSKVDVVAVVDNQHVLTKNFPGDVILWKLPECTPVYKCNCYALKVLPLSPGRKHVVLRGKKGLELFDLKTGKPSGRFPFPQGRQVHSVIAGGFRSDGKVFAAILSFGSGQGQTPREVVRWDTTTGRPIATQPTYWESPHLQWCGKDSLLLGSNLYDSKRGKMICYYLASYGEMGRNSPDQRFWFTYAQKYGEVARLVAKTVPEEQARQFIAQLDSGEVQFALKPGTKVSIQLDLTGPMENPKFVDQLRRQLPLDLDRLGLIVAEKQPITVRFRAKELDTGKMIPGTLTMKGGKAETRDIAQKRLDCTFSITDAQGKPLVPTKKETIELSALMVTYDAKDDPVKMAQQQQSKELWDKFYRWHWKSSVLPSAYVAREGDRIIPWPKTVDLMKKD